MKIAEEFEELRKAFDEDTNNLATKVADLTSKINAGGMTAEEELTVKEGLAQVEARLRALGSDPANPVPDPVP